MDAALLAMISTIFVAMLGNSWHQTRENSKTRDLVIQLNNDTRSELKSLGTELRWEIKALDTKLSGDIKALGIGLGDVRERLARIEGHLGIGSSGIGTARPPESPSDE